MPDLTKKGLSTLKPKMAEEMAALKKASGEFEAHITSSLEKLQTTLAIKSAQNVHAKIKRKIEEIHSAEQALEKSLAELNAAIEAYPEEPDYNAKKNMEQKISIFEKQRNAFAAQIRTQERAVQWLLYNLEGIQSKGDFDNLKQQAQEDYLNSDLIERIKLEMAAKVASAISEKDAFIAGVKQKIEKIREREPGTAMMLSREINSLNSKSSPVTDLESSLEVLTKEIANGKTVIKEGEGFFDIGPISTSQDTVDTSIKKLKEQQAKLLSDIEAAQKKIEKEAAEALEEAAKESASASSTTTASKAEEQPTKETPAVEIPQKDNKPPQQPVEGVFLSDTGSAVSKAASTKPATQLGQTTAFTVEIWNDIKSKVREKVGDKDTVHEDKSNPNKITVVHAGIDIENRNNTEVVVSSKTMNYEALVANYKITAAVLRKEECGIDASPSALHTAKLIIALTADPSIIPVINKPKIEEDLKIAAEHDNSINQTYKKAWDRYIEFQGKREQSVSAKPSTN